MEMFWKSLRRKYPDISTYRAVSKKIRKMRKSKKGTNSLSGAYIYADESGNSGRDIFNKGSPFYYQGAIFSVGNIEATVAPVIKAYCKKYNTERLHGYELGEDIVNEVCRNLIKSLSKVSWTFHYTIIEKRYIAATKFVDTVFDSFNNPAVHPFWYTTEIFRHTLCIVIDDMIQDGLDIQFWKCYLSDDSNGIVEICKVLLERSPNIFDKRVAEVVSDGLTYAINNPDIFTLTSAKGKSAYKKQTPNIIAFSSLLTAVHRFCNEFCVGVTELIHDRSDEFKGTMREYHRMFFGVDFEEDKFGGIPKFKEVEYDLGGFKIESSKNSYALQAADLFLWLVQRDINDDNLKTTKSFLLNKSSDFVISRAMSLAIFQARYFQLMQQEITPEQLQAGKELNNKIVSNQIQRMKK